MRSDPATHPPSARAGGRWTDRHFTSSGQRLGESRNVRGSGAFVLEIDSLAVLLRGRDRRPSLLRFFRFAPLSVPSKPRSTRRWRTFSTVLVRHENAFAIRRSVLRPVGIPASTVHRPVSAHRRRATIDRHREYRPARFPASQMSKHLPISHPIGPDIVDAPKRPMDLGLRQSGRRPSSNRNRTSPNHRCEKLEVVSSLNS